MLPNSSKQLECLSASFSAFFSTSCAKILFSCPHSTRASGKKKNMERYTRGGPIAAPLDWKQPWLRSYLSVWKIYVMEPPPFGSSRVAEMKLKLMTLINDIWSLELHKQAGEEAIGLMDGWLPGGQTDINPVKIQPIYKLRNNKCKILASLLKRKIHPLGK